MKGAVPTEATIGPLPVPHRTPLADMNVGPRRVLMIEANKDGTVGGSHQALYDLVRHLDRSRYEPVLLFYQENRFAALLRAEGFEVHLYVEEIAREQAMLATGTPVRKAVNLFGAIVRRRDFLGRHRIDAVHINNSPAVGNDDWLPAARLRRVPILANAMGDARGARGGPIHAWLFRRFDRVLPISEFMTDAMLSLGIPSERLTPIRLG
ncbi:MAG: glycosyltransferase, partial [Dehalococcoidia bacterium]